MMSDEPVAVLAIDPGLTMGWAKLSPAGFSAGAWRNLGKGLGEQMARLQGFLELFGGDYQFVYFEEGGFARQSNSARRVGGAIEGIVHLWVYEQMINLMPVYPSSVKRFVAGSGKAKKPAVAQVFRDHGLHWRDTKTLDVSDAIGVLCTGLHQTFGWDLPTVMQALQS